MQSLLILAISVLPISPSTILQLLLSLFPLPTTRLSRLSNISLHDHPILQSMDLVSTPYQFGPRL